MSYPIYISDPVGAAMRSKETQAFVVEKMHMPIMERLFDFGLLGSKWNVESLTGTSEDLAGYGGLILLGGPDVERGLYKPVDGDRTILHGNADIDNFELNLIHAAIRRGLPILGICRGHQLLNVYFGGTLHQDIDHIAKVRHHNFGEQAYGARAMTHLVQVRDSTALADGVYRVSSSHHQAVENLGADLRITGYAEDGIVEAIEHVSLPVRGVQWHPEASHIEQDDTLTPLLRAFARNAR